MFACHPKYPSGYIYYVNENCYVLIKIILDVVRRKLIEILKKYKRKKNNGM